MEHYAIENYESCIIHLLAETAIINLYVLHLKGSTFYVFLEQG